MAEEILSRTRRDFKRVLRDDDSLKPSLSQPSTAFIRGWSLCHVGVESTPFFEQASQRHFLADATPQCIKGSKRREGQHQLSAGLQVFDQTFQNLRPVRSKEHDR